MGHLHGDIYRRLGGRIDGLSVRAPWNETFHEILKELYSVDEADLITRMPYSMATFARLRQLTGYEEARLQGLLDGLCAKGLVLDLCLNGEFHYSPSPLMIGIFEFTMMRTGEGVDSGKLGRLFHEYLDKPFYAANCGKDDRVSIIRALPHEEALGDHVEILDYESARAMVEGAERFSIGICSCRHEKLHAGVKTCDAPLEKCSSFGFAADYLIRNRLAREASRSEMLENLAHSKETGLVLNADNVRRGATFICHCCGCCCNVLLGVSRFGYPNVLVTSNYIAHAGDDGCEGCGRCAKACPIGAIEMRKIENPKTKKKKSPEVDTSICLGCGVCALKCKTGAMRLVGRGKRVLHPETTFERIILQCLEKGTLQNQLFDDPGSLTHSFMRGLVGGFLRLPPVKRALMSDTLRSTFLGSMKAGARLQGNGWLLDL